ncbi:MAG: UDP-N-acetylglucosamine 2-epimerase (non-hydrolyzing) [Pirellulales bacterium]|nr:UDP-N-acetylglucosamine 2-epimerase (non-hydrolyzing) [Pirellulales bacterium]
MPRRVAVLMGTRPEAVKMAPVAAAVRAHPELEVVVINTGQHREMIQQVIDLFGIAVDDTLEVMRPDQTLAGLSARLLERIDEALAKWQPEFVLAQGDTTTVLCATLASFYRGIPTGHVEAGLRTGNLRSPFPEEANRRLVSRIADLHFAPTAAARDALLAEGTPADRVLLTGNTVIDALHLELQRQQRPEAARSLQSELAELVGVGFGVRPLVLVTGHRRENIGRGFDEICTALATLAARFRDVLWVYPVHLNPRVKDVVHARLGELENVRLIAPLPYSQFIALAASSRLILTDSGGVQEEAPTLGKPVLVMRDTTERPEGVAAGAVRLVGAEAATIIAATSELLADEAAYLRMTGIANPYGDGRAADRIAAAAAEFLAR